VNQPEDCLYGARTRGPAAVVGVRSQSTTLLATTSLETSAWPLPEKMGDPMSINGSAILAMTGKGCVAIAADRRYGIQGQVRAAQRSRAARLPTPRPPPPTTTTTTPVANAIAADAARP